MTERSFQSLFRTWVKENIPFSAAFELKCVDLDKKKSINFTHDFQPQQIPMLKKVKDSCVYHKISDLGMGQKPFDALNICNVSAFVVILFYKKRVKKTVYFIDVDQWIILQSSCGRKSATEEAIAEVASRVVVFK